MDIAIVAVGALCLGVIIIFAARSLSRREAVAEEPASPREALVAERDGVLAALQDLEADNAAAKLLQDDFIQQRAELMSRGAAILRRLDEVEAVQPPAPVAPVEDAWEAAIAARRRIAQPAAHANGVEHAQSDPLEAAIRARRRSTGAVPAAAPESIVVVAPAQAAGRACPGCGAGVDAGDRFCSSCGHSLPRQRACTHCHESAEPEDRFCGRCGTRLPENA